MPIFNDYSPDGKLLQSREEPLTAENFDRYVKENGHEMAKGYLDALEDVTNAINGYLGQWIAPNHFNNNTPTIVRNETKKLVSERSSFLEFARQRLAQDNQAPAP